MYPKCWGKCKIYLHIGVVLSTLSLNSYHFLLISSKMTHLPIEIIVLTYIPWTSIFSNQCGTSIGPKNPLLKPIFTLESLPSKNPSTLTKLGLYLVAQPINSKETFEQCISIVHTDDESFFLLSRWVENIQREQSIDHIVAPSLSNKDISHNLANRDNCPHSYTINVFFR